MIVATSPYELTQDSPALLASLLLAHQVVTLIPAPLEGVRPESIERALDKHPAFMRFVERSKWMSPLWHAGVLIPGPKSEHGPYPAIIDDARHVCARVRSDDAFESLRGFVDAECFDSTDAYLGGLATDLLRHGVAPTFAVTVSAAMDRFAARHRLPVIRSESASRVGAIEKRTATPFLRLSLPVPRVADGDTILRLRAELEAALDAAREALARAVATPEETRHINELRGSLAALEDSFRVASPNGARTVVLSFSTQPADRVLAVASHAAKGLAKRARKKAPEEALVVTELDLPAIISISARYSGVG